MSQLRKDALRKHRRHRHNELTYTGPYAPLLTLTCPPTLTHLAWAFLPAHHSAPNLKIRILSGTGGATGGPRGATGNYSGWGAQRAQLEGTAGTIQGHSGHN